MNDFTLQSTARKISLKDIQINRSKIDDQNFEFLAGAVELGKNTYFIYGALTNANFFILYAATSNKNLTNRKMSYHDKSSRIEEN